MRPVAVLSNHSSRIHAALQQLGITPEEVASALRWRGVQGVRNTVRQLNPVVRYLQSLMSPDGSRLCIVAGNTLRMMYADGRIAHEVLLPDAVIAFLAAFHRGAYPDLELPVKRL